jgi:SEC-C motif
MLLPPSLFARYFKPLRRRIPKGMAERSEPEIFADLERVCRSPGYIHVFSSLVVKNTFVAYGETITGEDFENTFGDDRLIRTELCTLQGLMLKGDLDFSRPTNEHLGAMEHDTLRLLEEMHHILASGVRSRIDQALEDAQPREEFSHGETLREPVFYTGESAFCSQYRDLAPLKYEQDGAWIESQRGFTIAQAANVGRAIFDLQGHRVSELFNSLRAGQPDGFTFLPAFTFTAQELVHDARENEAIISNVLTAFSVFGGARNREFKALNDFNLANAQPIIRRDSEQFVCFQSYSFFEALYESPFYWMNQDSSYKDTADKHRGQFGERVCAKFLLRVFAERHVYLNPKIEETSANTRGEIDVLVLFGNRAILVQAKSKRMTIAARKGNDNAIRKDIQASIVDAYNQALDCAQWLLRPKGRLLDGNGAEISLPALKAVYLICVVSDHYPALSLQALEFLSPTISSEIPSPFVTDVFTLDVMTEMLQTPLRLISYLDRRTRYGNSVISNHEMTVLAYHLGHNLWLDKTVDTIYLDDNVSSGLNAAMAVRRDNVVGERTPPGILTLMNGSTFEAVVGQIDRAPRPHLVDLGLMLLEMSGPAATRFSKAVDYVSHAAMQKGLSDFSLGDGEESGITIHANHLSPKEGLERLQIHAEIKKYRERKTSWFGLGIDPASKSILYGVNLEYEWKMDERLEANSRMFPAHLPTEVGGKLRPQKIGRNDLCPCNSGKKWKKCHGFHK